MDENNMTSDAIGIDLGTTYSCIGVWKNGRPEIIVNNQGNRTTPSYVAFNNIEMMTGEAAKNQVFANSENTIYCAKRLIGRSIDDKEVQNDMKHLPYKILDKDDKLVIRVELEKKIKYLTPEEVSSYMLTCLKKSAELFIGKPVKDAVITVPAYFNNAQRKSTMDAGKLAGLNVISIINEPTAAAIAYGLENQRSDKRTVLVFDLGGGTFDTTLLNITSKKFEVLATKGSSSLGGNDFDTRLVDHFVQLFKEKTGYDIKNESRPLSRLRLHVERAKCILSSVTRTSIQIDSIFRGIDFQESLTRAKFDDLCEDLFNSTTFYLDGLFSESNVSSDEVHDIILIGGSTRICKIQSIVSDYFGGKPLKRSLNPDEAVACGATILATILTKPVSEVMKDIILVDVTPISLGVETKGFKMKITVPRNTPLPFKKTSRFTTASDYQTSVAVYVYEGESANSRSNYLLGQFELSNIPPALKSVPGIDVTFSIDRNGLLHVKAYNVESGTANSIRINYNRTRLGKTEIDTMVEIQQHRR